jgi:hypothetical protein
LGLGVLGWSTNTVEPEVWYRVVVTSSGTTYKVFVNGELWIEKTGIEIDSRHALQIEELPHIFVDDDGEEGEIHCSELAVWDVERRLNRLQKWEMQITRNCCNRN